MSDRPYFGMKRCRFCANTLNNHMEITEQAVTVRLIDCVNGRQQKWVNMNHVCNSFRSAGLLPESAVDAEVENGR